MSNVPGEWAVSYHGMGCAGQGAIPGIINTGYKMELAKRQAYGKGNYSSGNYRVAEGYQYTFDINN